MSWVLTALLLAFVRLKPCTAASLGKIDVVSLALSPSCVTPRSIHGLNQYLNVGTIHIITASTVKCREFVQHADNIRCHLEDDLMEGVTLTSVQAHLKNRFTDEGSRKTAQERAGWYFQQLLKLGAAGALSDLTDHFMIWDLDMMPLQAFPLAFEADAGSGVPRTRVDISRVRISEYAQSYRRLFQRDVEYPRADHSYVAHWMLVYQPYLKEMLTEIEQSSGQQWPWALLDSVQPGYRNVYYGLSEYTMYISWVLQHKPGALEVMREKEWNRVAPGRHAWLALRNYTACCPDDALLDKAAAEGWAYLGWELGAVHAGACASELHS